MIAFVAMHLLQVLLWGAYKKPRELQWIVGVILFIVTLVLGLTGYLLPWDLNALLASRVAINISGNAPVLGPLVQQFLQDGNGITTLTINRFFGIHVWLMPALLVLLVALHLMIFRWNGPAGPPIDEAPKLKPGRFWPDQMFMDTVLSFAMFVIIVALAVFAPVPLDAKADLNNSQFVPYPAWYFLALYALLDVVGSFPPAIVQLATLFATIVGPTLLIVVLVVLPFFDRNPSRRLIAPSVGAGHHRAGDGRRDQPELDRPAQRRREPAAAQHHRSQCTRCGRRQRRRRAANRPEGTAGSTGSSTAAGPTPPTRRRRSGLLGELRRLPRRYRHRHRRLVPAAGRQPRRRSAIRRRSSRSCSTASTARSPSKAPTTTATMPPWKGTLTNKQIADVITYIRSAWCNKAGAVSEAEVAKVHRAQITHDGGVKARACRRSLPPGQTATDLMPRRDRGAASR